MKDNELEKLVNEEEGIESYYFWCPGCEGYHSLYIKNPKGKPVWSFNGDEKRPTFKPSLLVTYPSNPKAIEKFKEWRKERICHSFIIDGKIQFLNDCTHKLRGQTIELKPFKLGNE